jgi:metallo-beta-lactamase class B
MPLRSALLAGAIMAAASAAPVADPPAAAAHAAKAKALAGDQFAHTLFLCDPKLNAKVVVESAVKGKDAWVAPTWLFDDLAYVGSGFVGVFVLRTSKGLILFDSLGSAEEARDRLVPGLRALGLDPAQIRYVVVTHGHWDHYGGAGFLQQAYGARVALGAADWDLMEKATPGGLERAPPWGERADRPPPRRDMEVRDGDRITLGDKTVTLLVTPGHTPATLSALIPVSDHGKPYVLSLLGGTAFPRTRGPGGGMAGLDVFSASVERLAKASRAAGAVGLLNTHIFVDGTAERIAAVRTRKPGQPNPFVLGTEAVGRYYGMFDECLKAAAERPPPIFDVKALSDEAGGG